MEFVSEYFEKSKGGNFTEVAIVAHSGIVGDDDRIIIFNSRVDLPLNFDTKVKILYEFGKLLDIPMISFQEAIVDLNFNQTGKILYCQKHFEPNIWNGEIIYCSPNDKLIEAIKQ